MNVTPSGYRIVAGPSGTTGIVFLPDAAHALLDVAIEAQRKSPEGVDLTVDLKAGWSSAGMGIAWYCIVRFPGRAVDELRIDLGARMKGAVAAIACDDVLVTCDQGLIRTLDDAGPEWAMRITAASVTLREALATAFPDMLSLLREPGVASPLRILHDEIAVALSKFHHGLE